MTHQRQSSGITENTVAPNMFLCNDYDKIATQLAATNSSLPHMSIVLTHVEYCGKIFNEGENHECYGTAAHRMADCGRNSGGAEGKAKLSTGMDTIQEADSVQVWQTTKGQKGGSENLYREQQTAVEKRKASSTLADDDDDPPMKVGTRLLRGP